MFYLVKWTKIIGMERSCRNSYNQEATAQPGAWHFERLKEEGKKNEREKIL